MAVVDVVTWPTMTLFVVARRRSLRLRYSAIRHVSIYNRRRWLRRRRGRLHHRWMVEYFTVAGYNFLSPP
jgi:hypothetical protein